MKPSPFHLVDFLKSLPSVLSHSISANSQSSFFSISQSQTWARALSPLIQFSRLHLAKQQSHINGFVNQSTRAFSSSSASHSAHLAKPYNAFHTSTKSKSTITASPSSSNIVDFFPLRNTSSSSTSLSSANVSPAPAFSTQYHPYIFSHAAAGFAKNSTKPVILTEEAGLKSYGCGEDAFFTRFNALGVSDGVGGWNGQVNANPAMYARKIMHYCNVELDKLDLLSSEEDIVDVSVSDALPVDVLQRAYDSSIQDAEKEGIVGSTTACLVILSSDELRISNLGDCGVIIIRNNEFLFRTEEQVHSFNFPYQLGSQSQDKPSDAQNFIVKVQPNDVIIVASDGIFDNLFDEDILEIVVNSTHIHPNRAGHGYLNGNRIPANGSISGKSGNLSASFCPKRLCDALVYRAKEVSEDSRCGSPFQTKALSQGLYYQGGKADDISCVVAIVKEAGGRERSLVV